MMAVELVSATLVHVNRMTRLSARKNFIDNVTDFVV
jgi:hypothetical protein